MFGTAPASRSSPSHRSASIGRDPPLLPVRRFLEKRLILDLLAGSSLQRGEVISLGESSSLNLFQGAPTAPILFPADGAFFLHLDSGLVPQATLQIRHESVPYDLGTGRHDGSQIRPLLTQSPGTR